jgi:hypothetical protein
LDSVQAKYSQLGLEITITKIHLSRQNVEVIGLYRPPSSRRGWFQVFRDSILDLRGYEKLVLMGDLNCDLLLPDNPLTGTLQNILELGNLVFKSEFHLSPTRITTSSATCIDFIAVDRSLILSRYAVADFLLSDHHPVELDINVFGYNNTVPVMRRSFKNIDFNELGLKMSEIQLYNIEDPRLFETQLQRWNENFIAVLDDFALLRACPRCNKKPTWVDKDTRGLIRLRTSLARRIRTGSINSDDMETLLNLNRCITSRVRASIKNHGGVVSCN